MHRGIGGDVGSCFVLRVASGLADGEAAQAESESDVGGAEQEWRRAQPVDGGEVAGGQGGERDRSVSRGFVQSHGEAATCRPDEVDLHDDRG